MAQITTIIPTYRRPKLLQRAIRSVLGQTYRDFEISIFDDASDDDTAAVVRELARYDPRVKYHCNLQKLGVIPNFAYGMKQVTSPFFNLLSDDDILLPGFFETAIRSFASNPEAMLFVGGLIETASARLVVRYGGYARDHGLGPGVPTHAAATSQWSRSASHALAARS